MYHIIERNIGFACENDIPARVREVIEAMMRREPRTRPTVSEIKEFEWIIKSSSLKPKYVYENDSLILESMANFFEISVARIIKILENK